MRLVLVSIAVTVFLTGTIIHSLAEEPGTGLEGKWELVSIQYNGNPPYRCKGSTEFTFTKDKMVWMRRGKMDSYSYTTDKNTNPKQMDLLAECEGFKGQTFKAIYEVDGDTLRINMGGLPNIERPTEFGSEKEEGPKHQCFTLKRVEE
jgi:uncharacterized protein (TIGR03067 family)